MNRDPANRCRSAGGGSALIGSVLAIVIAGCGSSAPSALPSAPATPSPPAPTTDATAMGVLHLTSAPNYDWHDPLVLRYVLADGRTAPDSDSFEAETAVFMYRSLPAGAIRVLANEKECEGPVTIEADVEVDVVLSVVRDVCRIETTGSHPPGEIDHPEPRTAMGLIVPVDATVTLRALDPGNATIPVQLRANERGEVFGIEVPPGRYEASVSVDGEILVTREIALDLGQDWIFNLRVLPDDIPRECGGIAEAECEAAIAEAYAWGASFASGQRVTAVRVAPTRFENCDGAAEPAFEVFFTAANPSAIVEASVGRLLDGRYTVCTY